MTLCSCVAVSLRQENASDMKIPYRTEAREQAVESALGKRRVSLGESGSFVRGKSEFPLWKVKEAEMG